MRGEVGCQLVSYRILYLFQQDSLSDVNARCQVFAAETVTGDGAEFFLKDLFINLE